MGRYESEERTLEVLDEIEDFIEKYNFNVYQMPKE